MGVTTGDAWPTISVMKAGTVALAAVALFPIQTLPEPSIATLLAPE